MTLLVATPESLWYTFPKFLPAILEIYTVIPEDQQPPEAPLPQGPRISRDTLLLIGALAFLILAVALTFLFTPGTPGESEPTSVAIAASPSPPAPEPYPSPSTEPYPGPIVTDTAVGGRPSQIATGDPASEATPTDEAIEPFETDSVLNPTVPSYPGPSGEGTLPPLPTLFPTIVVITPAPPPTFPPVEQPTDPPVLQPTDPPLPTLALPPPPPPEEEPLPTEEPTIAFEPLPTESPGPPPPPLADVLEGAVRWGLAQSPVLVTRDVQIPPGAELLIEPGVEVRIDPGVAIYVDGGRLLALGLPNQRVRLVGASSVRWNGLFVRPDSFVVLENTDLRGGGGGGTLIAAERSELIVRSSRITDNGGAILLSDTRLELRDSEIAGNDMPFGPALTASYNRGSFVTLSGNRFGGNRIADGAPQVRLSNNSTFETLNLTVEGNLIRGGAPNLQLTTNGPLNGNVRCNAMIGDVQGFGLLTRTPQVAPNGQKPLDLRVENNYIDEHIPPIIPVYLRYGLGRGATSEVLLDMRNNWWGERTGPYHPEENVDGRGDSVGVNISFVPWLEQPPACAPQR